MAASVCTGASPELAAMKFFLILDQHWRNLCRSHDIGVPLLSVLSKQLPSNWFNPLLILEISLVMAPEKRADRGKVEVRRPTENFLMEIFGSK
jgi:hypothetical protein